MATFILNSTRAEVSGGFVSIVFSADAAPVPPEEIEARSTAEALQALERYKDKARATGKIVACNISLKRGQRAPAGFRSARTFYSDNVVRP